MMFPLFSALSVLTINYLFRFCERQTEFIVLVFNLATIAMEVILLVLGTDEGLIPVYIIVVAGIGFF